MAWCHLCSAQLRKERLVLPFPAQLRRDGQVLPLFCSVEKRALGVPFPCSVEKRLLGVTFALLSWEEIAGCYLKLFCSFEKRLLGVTFFLLSWEDIAWCYLSLLSWEEMAWCYLFPAELRSDCRVLPLFCSVEKRSLGVTFVLLSVRKRWPVVTFQFCPEFNLIMWSAERTHQILLHICMAFYKCWYITGPAVGV